LRAMLVVVGLENFLSEVERITHIPHP
jgi:hypothetical protein